MQYYSTSGNSARASLSQAIVHCVAPDGGIYMPASWPSIPRAFFNNIDQLSLPDIAYVVANSLFGEDVDGAVLKQIVSDSINFKIPLVRIATNLFALELFHGPSLSFKDIGTRFLARLYRHLAANSSDKRINVLVATTGNSGGAIANAFHGLDGVEVFILYPRGRLNRMQESQFATLGSNTHPIEVRGSIDDCNRLVDTALLDAELNESLHLTSANSLNLGRVLPQIIYFFEACARLQAAGINPSIRISQCLAATSAMWPPPLWHARWEHRSAPSPALVLRGCSPTLWQDTLFPNRIHPTAILQTCHE